MPSSSSSCTVESTTMSVTDRNTKEKRCFYGTTVDADRTNRDCNSIPTNIEHLSLPPLSSFASRIRIDDHIRTLQQQQKKSPTWTSLLESSHQEKCLSDKDGKLLNVLQGEIAHATAKQVDVLVSEDATTCHILAVRSYKSGSENDAARKCLNSMAHLDAARYEKDLKGMMEEHLRFHRCCHDDDVVDEDEECNHLDKRRRSNSIHMDLHILGGFDDEESRSIEISEHLIQTLVSLSDAPEFSKSLKMSLKTCAMTRMNDNGSATPIGRGLALNTHTGDVFLATVDKNCVGPALALRSCRIFSDRYESLNLIHTWSSDSIKIEPFRFSAFEDINTLLALPDNILLQIVSTSPSVEKPNFCSNFRRNLEFLKKSTWEGVFGSDCERSISYRRCTLLSNNWIEAVED